MTGTASHPEPLRALIADDERLLREQLKARLSQVWPGLELCGEARDGVEAVEMVRALRPDVAFLDIRMPGLTGIEAAQEIVSLPGWAGEIVFVTAYDEYAIAAFQQGALDYLLKPVETERLAQTALRLESRLRARRLDGPAAAPPIDESALDALLEKLLRLRAGIDQPDGGQREAPLRWIQCSTGSTTRLIDVNDVLFFRSDEKYTRVQTRDQDGVIRTPIRELLPRLDQQQFWQIHRSTIVNLAAITGITRDDTGRQKVHVQGVPEVLDVSRSYAHLFRGA